jgi:aryl-alcohol dehydrogenase-like predicted oxidoreductase
MESRRLGRAGPSLHPIGLGCMGMTPIYGDADEGEAIATAHRAIELGATHLDTSDAYGNGRNEELLARALKGRRDKVFLASKFGNLRLPDGTPGVNGKPDYVIKACEASLKRLGTEIIDLYYVHRIDSDTPIEDTVGAMAKLVKQGKIRHIGLSEAGPATIRRAHAVHPIAALQTELSLWTRDAEKEILPLCRQLGIAYVAYSPLGRGFLSGKIRTLDSLAPKDRRREHPRFAAENLARNVKLLDALDRIAKARNATAAQIALAWVLAHGPDVFVIPGAKRRSHLEENLRAGDIALTKEDLAALDAAFPSGAAAGMRYPADGMVRLGL